MKHEFRAHPLMIFDIVKPFLLIFLIPVARSLIQYFKNGEIERILGAEVFVFSGILLYAILRWRAFRLILTKNTITVRAGLILVKRAVIPISGLSSVQSEQTPLDYILRSLTFRLNTEAGSREKTDYQFKLSKKDSRQLSELLYGKKQSEPVKFSAVKIALLAVATSSAFAGMLVGVPIINGAARLFGLGFEELYEEIAIVSNRFETYFPPIVNTITFILLGCYLISFTYSFLRYLNFRLFLDENRIEVRSGFFVKIRTAFKKDSVNNIKIEQTFLMLLLRRYAMKVNVGGYGVSKSESQVLVPSGKYAEIREQFSEYFPFLMPNAAIIKSRPGIIHENRFLIWAELFFILTAAASIYSAYRFEEFSIFILFVTIVVSLVILYYAYLCVSEYKRGMLRFGETVFASGKKGLRRCQLYCSKERAGEIKLIRYPTDFYFKTCNVKITVRSETADNITIKHLDFLEVKDAIFNSFGIDE